MKIALWIYVSGSDFFRCGANEKSRTNESKVKVLGGPLRAEPSGRCSRTMIK